MNLDVKVNDDWNTEVEPVFRLILYSVFDMDGSRNLGHVAWRPVLYLYGRYDATKRSSTASKAIIPNVAIEVGACIIAAAVYTTWPAIAERRATSTTGGQLARQAGD
ncbi:hypothetical protein F4779DRAFT_615691 [Xylariaceae sp. FL0662B]|nr:hypothetical protein F4779DRAFT_615691 [Xylariaceae sp. FL0662B]